MTTFRDFTYVRPDMKELEPRFRELVASFSAAGSVEAQNGFMASINDLRSHIESMQAIVGIRHTIDTEDAFYDQENDYMDEMEPVYEGLKSEYYRALLASPFRAELESRWGSQLFRLADMQMKTFSPEVMEDLQTENRLSSEYVKLKASARIPFEGEERNLAQMTPFTESADRSTRERAHKAMSGFFAANAGEFDRIFDELVHIRDRIAVKLGFPNFVPLAYARLGRSDYDASMVARYRRQVYESIVPLSRKLRKRQAARLGLQALKFHDESLEFLSGNATPKGDPAWIIARGREMYAAMSPETDEFFRYMLDRGLLDLETRKGKAGGGYCEYIDSEKSPFIFSNFNGTSGDVDVLTHEAGHAFQCFRSRQFSMPEYHWPTLEACEIHSMSMEFFAWPWMKDFFGPDVDKYKFAHLSGALLFVPYGVAVDEFQHWVYENPEAGPAGRRAAWSSIEKKYLPHRDYGDDEFLSSGGFWYRQGHIFEDPFYYIDYTLAQVCAFEFWGKSMTDRKAAWAEYLGLCGLGGSKPFTGLLDAANLSNPFTDGTIARIVAPIETWLDGVDDSAL
ncbi:MAG: oligoendopeptidase F [Spirochaetes bacterium GWB1_59_5]|nr:MAG: oligoendopeptidase F [Spirochaetes bacterium GWB1_59_5]